MLRKVIVILGSLALLVTFLPTASTSFAAPPPPKQENIAALQETCSIIHIQLHGKTHTTTCLQARTKGQRPLAKTPGMKTLSKGQSSMGLIPNLGRDDSCRLNDIFVIWNYNYAGELCFNGSGYLGVKVYSVDQVDNLGGQNAWTLWYEYNSKTTTTLPGNADLVTDGSAFVTQLCYSC